MVKHLWEAKHPYYCSEGNYFSGECYASYESWADFLEEERDSDLDYNMVYRWDWRVLNEEGDDVLADDPSAKHELSLYIMGQRRALCRSVDIKVKPEDEASVREYLAPRWEYMKKLWEGML